MEHFFTLPVVYNGQAQSFNVRMVTFAYSYTYHIWTGSREIVVQEDEGTTLHLAKESITGQDQMDPLFLSAIIQALAAHRLKRS